MKDSLLLCPSWKLGDFPWRAQLCFWQRPLCRSQEKLGLGSSSPIPTRADRKLPVRQAEGLWAGPSAVLRDQEQTAQPASLSLQEQIPYLEGYL